MSKEHFDEHSIKKYMLAVFLAFAAVFCFLVLMMQWHGDLFPELKAKRQFAESESHAVAATTETKAESKKS